MFGVTFAENILEFVKREKFECRSFAVATLSWRGASKRSSPPKQ